MLAFLLTLAWYATTIGNESMTSMMSQMMSGKSNSSTFMPPVMPFYMWPLFASLGLAVIVAIFGLIYYLTFPQIKTASTALPSISEGPRPLSSSQSTTTAASADDKSWSTLLRTSKPEERKVLELLLAHGGSYLQKLIVKESGLSKLKVHRIIARFGDRGVVIVTKSGNTNEIKISDWLRQQQQPEGQEPHQSSEKRG